MLRLRRPRFPKAHLRGRVRGFRKFQVRQLFQTGVGPPGQQRQPSIPVLAEQAEELPHRRIRLRIVGLGLEQLEEGLDAFRLPLHIDHILGARLRAVGKGLLDIPGLFRALLKIGYTGHVGLEYEINETSPLVGMKESFSYMRGVLDAIEG